MVPEGPVSAYPEVVSPLHVRILGAVARAEEAYGSIDLRLEGGTALAGYYLGHRQSDDLDIFGGLALDARDFRAFLEDRLPSEGLEVTPVGAASRGFAECLVRGSAEAGYDVLAGVVRVQLGRASPFQLERPIRTVEGLQVASYRDVCAGKLHALCDRFEPRDFIDLHCIVRWGAPVPVSDVECRSRFRGLIADLEACDPGLGPTQVGQAVARGLDRPVLGMFPLRVLAAVSEADIQETIRLGLEECSRLTRVRADWESGFP